MANLSYSVNNSLLEEEFAKFGKVLKCNLIIDPVTQESRGFGFVTMEDSKDADEAIEALNWYFLFFIYFIEEKKLRCVCL